MGLCATIVSSINGRIFRNEVSVYQLERSRLQKIHWGDRAVMMWGTGGRVGLTWALKLKQLATCSQGSGRKHEDNAIKCVCPIDGTL